MCHVKGKIYVVPSLVHSVTDLIAPPHRMYIPFGVKRLSE